MVFGKTIFTDDKRLFLEKATAHFLDHAKNYPNDLYRVLVHLVILLLLV